MRLLSYDKRSRKVRYEASFWEGPIEAGQNGRRVTRVCDDLVVDRFKLKDDKLVRIGERLANTGRNCSIYPALEKALGIKWGEA